MLRLDIYIGINEIITMSHLVYYSGSIVNKLYFIGPSFCLEKKLIPTLMLWSLTFFLSSFLFFSSSCFRQIVPHVHETS